MDKIKVVVCVSGGNVQAIFSNEPVMIEMIDHDNMEAEGKDIDDRTEVYENAIVGLTQVY